MMKQTHDDFLNATPRIAEQAARLQEKNALSPDAIVQLSCSAVPSAVPSAVRWCPPVISWFIIPINYRYNPHKP